jgi:hypothetical protein
METPVSSPIGTPDERPVNPKLLLPRADQTLHDVGTAVEKYWATVPALTLLWLTPAAYSTALADFGTNLTDKRRVAAERSPNVQRLIELDDVADNALPFLKGYINEEAGSKENGKAAYTGHGMIRRGKNLEWADDRQARVTGIEMLLLKLTTGGPTGGPLPYATRKHGTAFWQQWLAEYKPLVEKSGNDAGTVSHKVSKKDEAKKTLRKALQAIIYLLKANYPDTFESELRAWGFRKESY